MRIKTLAGYAVEQYASPNAGGAMDDHHGTVLHIAEGTYRGTIAWQMNPDQRYPDDTRVQTCSTFILGRLPGEVAQMADTDRIAWCQRGGSRTWMSIELAGRAPQAPSPWQMEACAHLLLADHRAYGTALREAAHPGERGLGHHSMDREWLGEQWGHDACPGVGVTAAKPDIVARALVLAGQGNEMGPRELEALLNMAVVHEPEPGKKRTVDAVLTNTDTGIHALLKGVAALRLEMAALRGQDPVDEQALAREMWALLPAQGLDAIEDVLRAGLTAGDVAELGERLSRPAASAGVTPA